MGDGDRFQAQEGALGSFDGAIVYDESRLEASEDAIVASDGGFEGS